MLNYRASIFWEISLNFGSDWWWLSHLSVQLWDYFYIFFLIFFQEMMSFACWERCFLLTFFKSREVSMNFSENLFSIFSFHCINKVPYIMGSFCWCTVCYEFQGREVSYQFSDTPSFYLHKIGDTEVLSLKTHKFEKPSMIENSHFFNIFLNPSIFRWNLTFVIVHEKWYFY